MDEVAISPTLSFNSELKDTRDGDSEWTATRPCTANTFDSNMMKYLDGKSMDYYNPTTIQLYIMTLIDVDPEIGYRAKCTIVAQTA